MNLKPCANCHKQFRGEHWKSYCDDCYNDKKGILGETVPSSESHHPALRAEKEAVPLEFVPPDPERVHKLLEQMKAMFEPEEVFHVEQVNQSDCQHVFQVDNYYAPQCKCGVFEHQFNDNVRIQLEYVKE